MALKLYTTFGNPRSKMIQIAAEIAGLQLETVELEYSDLETKEHLERNPLGKIPVLETQEGCIFESHAILRYIASTSGKLYGSNLYQQGQVDQFLDFIQTELLATHGPVFAMIIGRVPFDKETYFKAKNGVQPLMKVLEQFLTTRKYLAGDELTIADLSLGVFMQISMRTVFDEKYRKTIPHVVEWFKRVAALPAFIKYQGRAFFTTAEWQPVATQQAKKPAEQQQKQEQQKKPAAPAKKEKESPKKQQKKKEENVDEDEAPKKSEKPAVTHKFDIYNFKTLYTNAKDKTEAVKFLTENWHEDDQCLYFLHYDKYEGEGTVLYQFNNQKNGFLQRSEAARKVAFGTYSIYGDEPNLEIKGVWLFQGTNIPEEMKENPQFEYHKVQKLNIKDAKDLQLLTAYWTQNEEDTSVVEGLKLRSFGTFK